MACASPTRPTLFPHEPHRSDEEMDAIEQRYRKEALCDLFASVEGMELSL